MVRCLVGLGSNLLNRAATLDAAVDALRRSPGALVAACSRWIETAPVGGPPDQPPYLNGAVTLDTDLPPERLLDLLQEIETAAGRLRDQRWAARPLDLDLLLYGEQVIETRRLTVPHPRMSFRRFVLAPACEVAADMRHPVCDLTLAELLAALDRHPRWLALQYAGETLVRELAERIDAVCYFDTPFGAHDSLESIFLKFDDVLAAAAPKWVIWAHRDMWLIAGLLKGMTTRSVFPSLIALHGSVSHPLVTAPDQKVDMFRGIGPLLRLDHYSEKAIVDELAAAIAAME